MLSRRHLLAAAAAAGLVPVAAATTTARSAQAVPTSSKAPATRRRQLVLIELQGGNDGLNTVIPLGDKRYAVLRPTLGISAREALPLHARGDVHAAALHPALRPLLPLWERGELAIVMGVGQPGVPSRSHFRARDLWNEGVAGDDDRVGGWAGAVLDTAARVLVIGGEAGPFDADGIAALAPAMPAIRLDAIEGRPSSALAHVLRVAHDVAVGRRDVQRALGATQAPGPRQPFARQIALAIRALASDLDVVGLKLTLGGFDTHVRQAPQQARLLGELATGLAALSTALAGRDDVVVAVQSEFGRRPRENGSGGTDHGTANVAFVFGGGIAGGLVGTTPSLDDLDDQGDLRTTIDQRALLGALAKRCFAVDEARATACFGVAPLIL